MDKGDGQTYRKLLPPQSRSDNHSNYRMPQPAAKTKSDRESSESNVIDYKNISLAMTGKLLSQPLKFPFAFIVRRPQGKDVFYFFAGEISSGYIHRNSLMQKQPNITFTEDTEDDDEQFISNMKMIIDNNCKT